MLVSIYFDCNKIALTKYSLCDRNSTFELSTKMNEASGKGAMKHEWIVG